MRAAERGHRGSSAAEAGGPPGADAATDATALPEPLSASYGERRASLRPRKTVVKRRVRAPMLRRARPLSGGARRAAEMVEQDHRRAQEAQEWERIVLDGLLDLRPEVDRRSAPLDAPLRLRDARQRDPWRPAAGAGGTTPRRSPARRRADRRLGDRRSSGARLSAPRAFAWRRSPSLSARDPGPRARAGSGCSRRAFRRCSGRVGGPCPWRRRDRRPSPSRSCP